MRLKDPGVQLGGGGVGQHPGTSQLSASPVVSTAVAQELSMGAREKQRGLESVRPTSGLLTYRGTHFMFSEIRSSKVTAEKAERSSL